MNQEKRNSSHPPNDVCVCVCVCVAQGHFELFSFMALHIPPGGKLSYECNSVQKGKTMKYETTLFVFSAECLCIYYVRRTCPGEYLKVV